MANQQKQRLTSPKGVAMYPSLDKPDTKFDTAGKYNVKLRIPKEECEEFMKTIKAVFDANYADAVEKHGDNVKKANLPFKPHEEEGKKTGDIVFNFAMKARGTSKDGTQWEQRPKIFGPAGELIPAAQVPKIGGGSVLKVNHHVDGWYTAIAGAGVSLRLRGVQVIELVEYGGGGTAEDFGFAAEGEALDLPEAPAANQVTEPKDADF